MARYTASACRMYVSRQQDQLTDAIRVIDRYFAELEFANAREGTRLTDFCDSLKTCMSSKSRAIDYYHFE